MVFLALSNSQSENSSILFSVFVLQFIACGLIDNEICVKPEDFKLRYYIGLKKYVF